MDLGRAQDVKIGHAGQTHALIFAFDSVPRSKLGAFWRGLPAPEKILRWMKKSLEEGLDTTSKIIKLCISAQLCGHDLKKMMFFFSRAMPLGAPCALPSCWDYGCW